MTTDISDITWFEAWCRISLCHTPAALGLHGLCPTKHFLSFNRQCSLAWGSSFAVLVFIKTHLYCFVGFCFQRRCVLIPWSHTLIAVTAQTPVTLSWAMSGSGRSHQSYPEETGHLNSTCQRLYKWTLFFFFTHHTSLSHRAFAYILLHLFQHANACISKEKIIQKLTSLFQRMNMDSRKSPKLSRASQDGQRSPRLPTKKPPVRSPSLTRREFSMDGITEVWYVLCITSSALCCHGTTVTALVFCPIVKNNQSFLE